MTTVVKTSKKADAMAVVRSGWRAALEFRFRPNRDTIIAFTLGLLVIGISLALPMFTDDAPGDTIAYVFLRDVVMIAGLGFMVPIFYTLFIKKRDASELGVTRNKWLASVAIGLALAVFFLFNFIGEAGQEGQDVFLDAGVVSPIFYLMLVGAFEVVFFYVFLRQQFEEAFGVLPGMVLAAAFYSLHHAGFQPEFLKLFFVGLIYAGAFRLTLNLLVVYPFFWGVGGCWDVLVMSDAVSGHGIANSSLRGLLLLALMATIIAFAWRKAGKRRAAGRARGAPAVTEAAGRSRPEG